MASTLYMVVEHFKNNDAAAVYRRFRENGRMAPELAARFEGGEAIVLPGLRDIALLIVLGVVCTALAHTLFIRSMHVLSAHTASVVTALEPVYGIALAFALLGETPGWRTLIGAALIVGAALRATSRASLVHERLDEPDR